MGRFLFQIFFDEATRARVRPPFLPLDNSGNERPDWREYWPMRRFLLAGALEDDAHYGFFSPQFLGKAAVTADEVTGFVDAHAGSHDVIGFGPFPDQHALFWNVFEQCDWSAPGLAGTCQRVFDDIGLGVDLGQIVNDSHNSIFCNYFCATPRFWTAWLDICERIFALAERRQGPLAQALNTPMDWRPGSTAAPPHFKVFVIERIVSLVLARDQSFRSVAYKPFLRPRTGTPLARFVPEMLMSDALKIAFARYGDEGYRGAFGHIRNRIKSEVGDGRG